MSIRIIKFYSLITVLFIFASCGSDVIRRDRTGEYRGTEQPSRVNKFFVIKKKVALLDFFNEAPYGGEDLGVTATEEFRRELLKTGEFTIEPESAKLFGSSKEIYSGGGVKLAQLSKKAKLSGINFVLFGRIVDARVRQKSDEIGFVRESKAYTEAKIEVRMYDINSLKELFFMDFLGNVDDKTYKFYMDSTEENLSYRQDLLRYSTKVAARKAIPKVMEISQKLEWTGRVARILGTKIYVNAGRDAGINVGDVLKVITEGEEIYDPETGALIGMSQGEVKGTLEVIDYFGPDGSVAVLHSGGSVTEGDFVKLY